MEKEEKKGCSRFFGWWKKEDSLQLEIGPVIERAQQVQKEIDEKLATHKGIRRVSQEVLKATIKSRENAKKMNHPFAIHRIPTYLIVLLFIGGIYWVYCNFFLVSSLRMACPERDTKSLLGYLKSRVAIQIVSVEGSAEGLRLLAEGKAEMCFIQGGVDIPPDYHRIVLPDHETVLLLVREGVAFPEGVQVICTSVKDQESHFFAKRCLESFGKSEVRYVHEWGNLVRDPAYKLPSEVDAVFVTKALDDPEKMGALKRLMGMGFKPHPLDLGAWGDSQEYLKATQIRKGYFFGNPSFPDSPIMGYLVKRYLVAPPRVNPVILKTVGRIFYPQNLSLMRDREEAVGEILQKADSFSQVFMAIGFVLISLVGLGVLSYRKRFNELNNLISLLSIHQSSKDLHSEVDPAKRRENRTYLACCSDLLGIIDVITGYYTQANSALLFNGFSSIIHQRCSNLKINIQLKIQHSMLKYSLMMAHAEDELSNGSPEKKLDEKQDNRVAENGKGEEPGKGTS